MTLSINSIDILDMCFANDVSTAEFEHWLTHIQQYFEHKNLRAHHANCPKHDIS